MPLSRPLAESALGGGVGALILPEGRPERGRFRVPTVSAGASSVTIDTTELAMLLDGSDVDPRRSAHGITVRHSSSRRRTAAPGAILAMDGDDQCNCAALLLDGELASSVSSTAGPSVHPPCTAPY